MDAADRNRFAEADTAVDTSCCCSTGTGAFTYHDRDPEYATPSEG
jgi:hypothetical protein